MQKTQTISIVSKNYRLGTNKEALELAKKYFKQLFNTVNTNDMEIFNIIRPVKNKYYVRSCNSSGVRQSIEGDPSPAKRDSCTPYYIRKKTQMKFLRIVRGGKNRSEKEISDSLNAYHLTLQNF